MWEVIHPEGSCPNAGRRWSIDVGDRYDCRSYPCAKCGRLLLIRTELGELVT